jgi:hypothetical protein
MWRILKPANLRRLALWVPVLALTLLAWFVPDEWIPSPNSTTPNEAAFVYRFWLIVFTIIYVLAITLAPFFRESEKPDESKA